MQSLGRAVPAAALVLLLAATSDCHLRSHEHRVEFREGPRGGSRSDELETDHFFHQWGEVMAYSSEVNEDPCLSNPCLNQGSCQPKSNGFECLCKMFFTGKYCEKENHLCRRSSCIRGECVLTKTLPRQKCRCQHPYSGQRCITALDPCNPNPCLNGGDCGGRPNNEFVCLCPLNYKGKFCETAFNECYEGNGAQYRGKVSRTEQGRTCLPWDSYLLVREINNALMPGAKLHGLGEHNYCRNPDGIEKPWCYFRGLNGTLKWDLCSIHACAKSVTPVSIPATIPVPRSTPKSVPRPTEKTITPVTIPALRPVPISTPKSALKSTEKTLTPVSIPALSPVSNSTPKSAPRPTEKALRLVSIPAPMSVTRPTMPTPTENTTVPDTAKAAFSTCGIPELPATRGRILHGKRVTPGRHPWQASLGLKVRVQYIQPGHLCGGSLISACWVLSAAHCIPSGVRPENFTIALGKQDLLKNETSEQIFDVKSIIVHEQYEDRKESYHNDIALLELKKVNGKCAQETRYVKTICLPDIEFPPGKNCFISGWGVTETGATSQLMHANVMIISEDRCSEARSYGKNIDGSMLCAGILEGGADSCQGDSGGPLSCQGDGPFHLAGVVSWGEDCGVKDKPGVYAHVFKFLPWIRDKMREK
ncbi:hyaluronan-binding protein 2 [Ambystoma mexicanum]|uniref:hyaluronan-binding protein 2 n=1 Tax=Ambystoma mexicanum TaxID=8296 RepID=UPI0037E82F6B